MDNQINVPKRKRIRLEGYDYSFCGAYFVTICVAEQRELLWTPVGANCVRPELPVEPALELPELPPLSDIGQTVDNEIQRLNDIYENVFVDKYCIMPDHLHMIIFITPDGHEQPALSRIIKQFKGSITKQIGFSIWQKSFNDRIIRNEKAYREAWQYIEENPLKRLMIYKRGL